MKKTGGILMRLYDFISFEALEFWFSDEGEMFERDVSAVHVICILYSKDNLLDFSVDIFGMNGINSLPIYSEVMPVESDEVVSTTPTISPLFVVKFFDKRILNLFSSKGFSIHWNPAWSTNAVIDPLHPDPSMKLIPKKE